METDTICQKCGVVGYPQLLLFCSMCKKNAEHEYCLFNYPNEDVDWSCEVCSPIFPKVDFCQVSMKRVIIPKASQNICAYDVNHTTNAAADLEILNEMINPIDISSSSDVSVDVSCSSNVNADASSSSDASDFLLTHIDMTQHEPSKSAKRIRATILDDESFDEEETSKRKRKCSDEGLYLTSTVRKYTESDVLKSSNVKDSMDFKENMSLQCRNAVDDVEVVKSNRTKELLDDEFPDGQNQAKVSVSDLGTIKPIHVSDDASILQSKVLSRPSSPNVPCYVPALPIINSCWSGYFNIHNETNISVSAHLSSRASQRVYYAAHKLPLKICLEKKSKVLTWPESFRRSPPTDDNIGLFFLPLRTSDCPVYEQTMDEVIAKDVVLVVILEEAELLVFPSTELPESFQRFQSKLYFWGVFRRKQSPISYPPSDSYFKAKVVKEQLSLEKLSKEIDCGVALSNDPQPSLITSDPQRHPYISAAKVPSVCSAINPDGFWQHILSSQRRYADDMQKKLTTILCGCVDSVGFALDALSVVFPTDRNNYTKYKSYEWVCLMILESLAVAVPKDELLTLSNARKQARMMVNEWKNEHHKHIFQKNSMAPPYAHTFLLLIVTFGIVIQEEKAIYKKLIMCLVKKRRVLELAGSLELGGEIQIDIIKQFINFDEIASALACIYEFRLTNKFPPLPLLKAYLQRAHQEKSAKKFHDLIAVVKYIRLFKLEVQIPIGPLERLIARTKRAEVKGAAMKRAEVKGSPLRQYPCNFGTKQEKNGALVPSSSPIGISLKPLKNLKKISKVSKWKHKVEFSPPCMRVQPKPSLLPLPSSSMPLPRPLPFSPMLLPSPLPSSSIPSPQPLPPLPPSKVAMSPQPPPPRQTLSLAKPLQHPPSLKQSSLAKLSFRPPSPRPSSLVKPPQSLPVLSSKKPAQPLHLGSSSLVKPPQSPPPLGPSALAKPPPSRSSLSEKSLQPLESSTLTKLHLWPSTMGKTPPSSPPSSLVKPPKPQPLRSSSSVKPPPPSSSSSGKPQPSLQPPSSLVKPRQPPPPLKPTTLSKPPSTAALASSTLAKPSKPLQPPSLKPLQPLPPLRPSTLAKPPKPPLPSSLGKARQSPPLWQSSSFAKPAQPSRRSVMSSHPLRVKPSRPPLPLRPLTKPPQYPSYPLPSQRLPPPHLYPSSLSRGDFPPNLSHPLLFNLPLLPPSQRNHWLQP